MRVRAPAFRAVISLLLLAAFAGGPPLCAAAPEPGAVRIERVTITGNRTAERVLRRRLPFSEGDVLRPDALKEARTALWDMRQFKKVEVSSSAAPGGGAEVRIVLEDGWYLIPLPIYSGGSGGGRGGLVVSGMNLFRQAESLMASAFSGPAGASASLMARREGRSLGVSVRRSAFAERLYEDGAYSAVSGFSRPQDEEGGGYGAVSSAYRRSGDGTSFSAGMPVLAASGRMPGLSVSAGWERYRLRFSDPRPLAPDDPGRRSEAFVSLTAGRRDGGGDPLGAILGFGLADMERRLAPLPAPKFASGGELSWHGGSAWTGSDFGYGYLLWRWDGSLTWGTHRSLSLRLAGGRGEGLPSGRMLSTGRVSALSGAYAREFRGDSAAGAGLTYSHPFRITRRGIWQGILFAETARAWGGSAASGSKTGAGAGFWYKFWRFPVPFGLSYTYSFDDTDAQATAAMGGRF